MKTQFTFLFCLLFFGKITCQDSIVQVGAGLFLYQINSFQHEVPLKNYVGMLEDPHDKYEIADILKEESNGLFQSAKQTGKDRYSAEERPWGKFSLKNNLSHPTLWSVHFHQLTDSVKVYIVDENKAIDTLKIGTYIRPKDTKNGSELLSNTYNQGAPIFLSLEKGEQKDIYFKVYPNNLFGFPINLTLRSMESSYKYVYTKLVEYIKAFFYLGLIWMLVLYNLFIFFFYKDKTYLYLSLYALCFAWPSDNMTVRFFVKTWLSNYPAFIDFKWIVLNPAVFITISYFSRSLLNTKINYPKTDKYFKAVFWIGWVHLLVNVSDYLITSTHNISRINTYLYIASIAVIIIFLFIFKDLYKLKNTFVRFWLWGMSFLILFQLLSLFFQIFADSETYSTYVDFFGVMSPVDFGILGQIAIFTMGAGHRSREIANEKKELEKLDQLKSRFFTNISHEFRTPLTLVMGPIQEVMEKQGDPNDKKLLQVAHRNASRLLQLINQLLDLSKLEAGKMELKTAKLNFAALMKGIVMSFESLAQRKNIRLHFVSQREDIPLFVDQDKMEKIFYNLLSNAFKFTGEGGEVSVMVSEQTDYVDILIRDTGIGIPASRLPFVFDRFYQVDSSEIREQDGTGIGLTLVKELVQLHGGEINVESEEGKGTAFKVRLLKGKGHLSEANIVETAPILDPDPSFSTKPNEVDFAPILSEKKWAEGLSSDAASDVPMVLIIEDNADVRGYIKQHLTNSFQILEAVNGQEGIDLALEHLPDLIISDVMMPKRNGYEVCQTLKTDQRTSHIPIILLTAKAAQEEKLKVLETWLPMITWSNLLTTGNSSGRTT
ncbi:MAG: ATP-binding protein [Saprospiraceae bacterium]